MACSRATFTFSFYCDIAVNETAVVLPKKSTLITQTTDREMSYRTVFKATVRRMFTVISARGVAIRTANPLEIIDFRCI